MSAAAIPSTWPFNQSLEERAALIASDHPIINELRRQIMGGRTEDVKGACPPYLTWQYYAEEVGAGVGSDGLSIDVARVPYRVRDGATWNFSPFRLLMRAVGDIFGTDHSAWTDYKTNAIDLWRNHDTAAPFDYAVRCYDGQGKFFDGSTSFMPTKGKNYGNLHFWFTFNNITDAPVGKMVKVVELCDVLHPRE
ncbi:hypothetical protein HY642_02170 [Candidatus Woesearchaeota archaeon]|nr:hypothetical protein [Candidatus Woesearchaeota archaeon]